MNKQFVLLVSLVIVNILLVFSAGVWLERINATQWQNVVLFLIADIVIWFALFGFFSGPTPPAQQ